MIIKPPTYYKIFAALIVLTVVTVGIDLLGRDGYVHLGALHTPISLLIAVVKASLVILFFMHVWYSTRLTWIVALSSLLWLGIMMTYTLTDYFTRGWAPISGQKRSCSEAEQCPARSSARARVSSSTAGALAWEVHTIRA